MTEHRSSLKIALLVLVPSAVIGTMILILFLFFFLRRANESTSLEVAESRAEIAVKDMTKLASMHGEVTELESTGRQRCEEGITKRFKGKYDTSLSFKVSSNGSSFTNLDRAVNSIESYLRENDWKVQKENLADSPVSELTARSTDSDLRIRYFGDLGNGGFLRVSVTTDCKKPNKP